MGRRIREAESCYTSSTMYDADTQFQFGPGQFPTTQWSMVLRAQDPAAVEHRQGIDNLVRLYWRPIYLYIRTSWSKSNEDAKDLTQGFLTKLIEGGVIEGYEKEKGRFRSYLKSALHHFLIDRKREESRKKRGGGRFAVTLEEELPPIPTDAGSPEELFDRAWAQTVLDRALSEVRDDLIRRGRERCWNLFDRVAVYPSEDDDVGYRKIGEEIGLTEEQVKGEVRYVRALARQAIERLVADSVSSESDLYQELKELFE